MTGFLVRGSNNLQMGKGELIALLPSADYFMCLCLAGLSFPLCALKARCHVRASGSEVAMVTDYRMSWHH